MRTIKQALKSGLTIHALNFALWQNDEGYYWVTDSDDSYDDQLNYPIICTENFQEALNALEKTREIAS
jgi:hypothetical protein